MKNKEKFRRRTFQERIDILKKKALNDSERSLLIGGTREMMVELALWHLQNEKKIISRYMRSGKFSKSDAKGVDFFLVAPIYDRHEIFTLSVVSPYFETKEHKIHPNIDLVLSVDVFKDSVGDIAARIERFLFEKKYKMTRDTA